MKLYVLSHPWLVSKDAFKVESSLMLQDLTYVSVFSENDGFAELRPWEPDYAQRLLHDITNEIAGMLLWVYLVIYWRQEYQISSDDCYASPKTWKNCIRRFSRNLNLFFLVHVL
jgi:hypothetical protein